VYFTVIEIQIEREIRSIIGVVRVKVIPVVIKKGTRLYIFRTIKATKIATVRAIVNP